MQDAINRLAVHYASKGPQGSKDALLDLIKGGAAGVAGLPGDAVALASDAFRYGTQPGAAVRDMATGDFMAYEDRTGTSDALGKLMGANIHSPEFVAGTIGTPDPKDLLSALGLGGKAMFLGMRGRQRLKAAGQEDKLIPSEPGVRDKLPRWELSDHEAKYREGHPRPGSYHALDEVIDHPTLFEAYPSLREHTVQFIGNEAGASVDHGARAIKLPRAAADDPDAALGSILHEAQHVVQADEGHASGANAAAEAMMGRDTFAHVVRDAMRDHMLKLGADPAAADKYANQFADFSLYDRASGEFEARNTAARKDLTPQDRAAFAPGETEEVRLLGALAKSEKAVPGITRAVEDALAAKLGPDWADRDQLHRFSVMDVRDGLPVRAAAREANDTVGAENLMTEDPSLLDRVLGQYGITDPSEVSQVRQFLDQASDAELDHVRREVLTPADFTPLPVRQRDDRLYHPIGGGKKMKAPPEYMNYRTEPTRDMTPQQKLAPEDLEGKVLVSAFGDRTAAGQRLTHVGDDELTNPVELLGGPDFMRANPGYAWALGEGTETSKLANAIARAQEMGEPVLTPILMGPTSGDFSSMMGDSVLERLLKADIDPQAKRSFDWELREGGPGRTARPDWLGLDDPNARTQLDDLGALRHDFLGLVDKAHYQDAGFPDLAHSRVAITRPDLVNAETGSGGMNMAVVTGEPRLDPSIHKSYPSVVPGEYIGGLDRNVPWQLLFPDAAAARAGKSPAAAYRSMQLAPQVQKVTPEMVESLQRYLQAP